MPFREENECKFKFITEADAKEYRLSGEDFYAGYPIRFTEDRPDPFPDFVGILYACDTRWVLIPERLVEIIHPAPCPVGGPGYEVDE